MATPRTVESESRPLARKAYCCGSHHRRNAAISLAAASLASSVIVTSTRRTRCCRSSISRSASSPWRSSPSNHTLVMVTGMPRAVAGIGQSSSLNTQSKDDSCSDSPYASTRVSSMSSSSSVSVQRVGLMQELYRIRYTSRRRRIWSRVARPLPAESVQPRTPRW
jgi:hypothetical protein